MQTSRAAHTRLLRLAPLLLLAAACQGNLSADDSTSPAGAGQGGANVGSGGAPAMSVPRPPAGTFAGPIVSSPAPSSRFLRLNHAQWENSVRDALKLSASLGLSGAFVGEPLRTLFDTNGSVLSVSADTFRDYQIAAESLAKTIAHDTTIVGRFAPTKDATALIQNLGKRAFRRPLTDAEVSSVKALFDKGKALVGSGDDFADGVELVATYLFQSPYFLYRTELSSTVVAGKIPLNGYEIASKLAYALTASMPDDTLLAAADASALSTREQVLAEAKRLLATKAAAAVVADFHDQLLMMRDFDQISKDARFAGFGAGIGADLKGEAKAFIQSVAFEQDRGFQTLMSAPYTFANTRIRGLYGLPSVAGEDPTKFSRVELNPAQRSGLLTQIGFLAANGEQDMPNIIIRGVHIARQILCSPLPAPPDNVPPLPGPMPNMTNRMRVSELTKNAPCSACHTTIINPLGYAFESLDGVGQFRTMDNGLPIDTTATFAMDGANVSFNGPVELVKAIAQSEQAHACYAQHWAEYLYGRPVAAATDQSLIQQGGWLSRDKESLQNLIINLLATDAFLTRSP